VYFHKKEHPSMRRLLLLSLLVACLSTLANAQETDSLTLNHGDTERYYFLTVPESYSPDEPLPLLLVFHGYTSSARYIRRYSGFDALAEQEGFIAVYPQGTLLDDKTHWNVGGWTLQSTTDDVDFVETLIDHLTGEYAIDAERIYATGMSNGGYMSFLLGCQVSDRIAAIASVTGSMTTQTYNKCDPERPVPVLQFHGTTDPTVPYEGDERWTMPIDDVLMFWKSFNHTKVLPDPQPIPDIDPEDGSTVEHYVYDNANTGIAVEHYKVIGGEHDWFGVRGNKDIQATQIIWEFLSKYDLKGLR
jgi:polyhydroxybutyrate depolymerase